MVRALFLKSSAIVALSLVIVLSGAGAYASALSAEDDADQRTATPRIGDRVAYSGANRTTGEPEPAFHFGWVDRAEILDPWGRTMEVDRLELLFGETSWFRYGYLGGSLSPDTVESPVGGFANGGDGSTASLGAQGDGETRLFLQTRFAETSGPAALMPLLTLHEHCALRGGWQGLPLSEIPNRPAGEICPGAGALGDRFEATGTRTVDGEVIHLFTVHRRNGLAMTLAIHPDIPYPLAIKNCAPALGIDCGSIEADVHGVVLSGFERGDGPSLLPPAGPRPAGSRPADWFDDFSREGPRDGRPGGFALEDALQAVREDSNMGPLHRWLKANPDATLVGAAHTLDLGERATDATRENWILSWGIPGTDEHWAVSSARDQDCGPAPGAIVPGGVARAAGVCKPSNRFADGQGFTPAALPTRALSFQKAADLYHETATEGHRVAYAAYDIRPYPHITVFGAGPRSETIYNPMDGRSAATPDEGVEIDLETGALTARYATHALVISPGTPGPLTATTPLMHRDAPSGFVQSMLLGSAPRAVYGMTGAVAVGGLLAIVAGARLAAFGVVLYTRLSGREILAHPKRALIHEALRAQPGLSTQELQDAANLGSGATRYHLGVMVRAGELARLESGGFTRYFVSGSADFARFAQEAVLLNGGAEARVLQALQTAPGVHAADVARKLAVSRPAVHYVLARLVKKGLVEQRKEGARTALYAKLR